MKYFALIVTYTSGKKGVFLTNNADLTTALIEFKNAQIRGMTDVLDKSYAVLPEIASAEIVKLITIPNE